METFNGKKAYVLNQKISSEYNAAGKAMRDLFQILTQNGIKIMPGIPKNANKYLKILDLFILAFYMLFILGDGDYCFYSFPENEIKIRMLKILAPIRNVKTVCFINDINSVRYGDLQSPENQKKIKTEMELTGSASVIIAPNNNSKKFLKQQGVTSKIITVGVWDYLIEEDEKALIENDIHTEGSPWKIAFAGNLGKSSFIQNLDEVVNEKLCYYLYGGGEKV